MIEPRKFTWLTAMCFSLALVELSSMASSSPLEADNAPLWSHQQIEEDPPPSEDRELEVAPYRTSGEPRVAPTTTSSSLDLAVLDVAEMALKAIDLQEKSGNNKRKMSERELEEYIEYYSEKLRQLSSAQALADWRYSTNITDHNSAVKNKMTTEMAGWQRGEWKENLTRFDLGILDNPGLENLKRMYKTIEVLGTPALDDKKYKELTEVITNMTSVYSSAKICPNDRPNCDVTRDASAWSLSPELDEVFAKRMSPDDYETLQYAWKEWHDVTGKKLRHDFLRYVELTNEGARANRNPKIKDGKDLYLDPYESPTFAEEIASLYEQLKPFYQELHAFVRHRLAKHYGPDKVNPMEPIPAHVLGNMWAQEWGAIYPIVSEFKQDTNANETSAMVQQKYTVRRMFEMADDFFGSLGLVTLRDGAPEFYQKSMLVKPEGDREVVCHASAWDMFVTNGLPGDFRIKMCTVVAFHDLVTVHHELGHVQYYMQYVNLPMIFRDGANPGFHEAIGDTLALSVATPKHLEKIGLFGPEAKHSQMAFLLKMAMDKVAFLPFAYILDMYRWKVFNGSISPQNLNAEWWKLREEYQGIKAPVFRSEEDFDPAGKYHVVSDVEYIRYFVARILQFSFHQAMCQAAGQFDPSDPDKYPLHECDVHGSKAAGLKIGKLMRDGASKHWKEVLEEMTGNREMTVEPMLNYFKPLRIYLKEYISGNNVHVGWD